VVKNILCVFGASAVKMNFLIRAMRETLCLGVLVVKMQFFFYCLWDVVEVWILEAGKE